MQKAKLTAPEAASGDGRPTMANNKQPITIKKYANRRLYNTGTSAYVTLEDLAGMVKKGEDFVVFDAKSGEDITRSVLTQIIFEQEGKGGQSLLPIAFLRQLIRFYGDSMQMLVPSYLEFSIDKLTSEQSKFRDKVAGGFGSRRSGRPSARLRNRRARTWRCSIRRSPCSRPSWLRSRLAARRPQNRRPSRLREAISTK